MPKAHRWKSVSVNSLVPGNIIVHSRKLGAECQLKAFLSNKADFYLQRAFWDHTFKVDEETPFYVVVSNEKIQVDQYYEVFKISMVNSKGEPCFISTQLHSRILIVNDNYEEEKRIQNLWKLENNWKENKRKRPSMKKVFSNFYR